MSLARRTRVVVSTYLQNPQKVAAFGQLRKRLFVDKLGWKLSTRADVEWDEFDGGDAEYCVVSYKDTIVGGFRAIRTDRDYLAASVFPQLASLRAYPRQRDKWEISRFGILADEGSHELALLNYSLMFRFARTRGATALVALADLLYERYLRTLGIRTRRFGPPKSIGIDTRGRELVCVAGEIPLTEQPPERLAALLDLSSDVEIDDAVSRPQAVSA